MTFDPLSLLDSSTTEAATRRPPLPVGDYIAVIGEITQKQGTIGKGERSGQPWYALNVPLEVDLSQYPQAQEAVGGQPKLTLFHMVMLDVNSNGLDFGPGKNNNLRRYREALDMNQAGQPFAPRQMQGRPIKVRVKHEPYEGELQERVDTVMKVS